MKNKWHFSIYIHTEIVFHTWSLHYNCNCYYYQSSGNIGRPESGVVPISLNMQHLSLNLLLKNDDCGYKKILFMSFPVIWLANTEADECIRLSCKTR
jgi:hypothetical protein